MATKERVLPPQVLAAKLRGDTDALRAMSRKGNAVQALNRSLIAESIARMSALEAGQIADERRKFPANMTPDERAFAELCAYLHHSETLAGARSHAMRNLAGSSQN